ncbi:MAG: methyltransferase domain-containing protein [Vicinamibacteria bacterium]|nr:methyltransferase domain-containing protein [Vicinamibacteria bacterium]
MNGATERARCVVCGDDGLAARRFGPALQVWRCRGCGHRVAEFERPAGGLDYHEQYEGGAFLEALARIRTRQAGRIVDRLRELVPVAGSLLDVGAGRGFFLDVCRHRGLAPLAALDASPVALDLLAQRGHEVAALPGLAPEPLAAALGRLSFPPRIVTLLDVVEHLDPQRTRDELAALRRALPSLELLVVKVPVGEGLLHQAALGLGRLGLHGPLHQLYQVGTWPPHRHYFSRGSLRRLLVDLGLRIVAEQPELEFEPETLGSRVRGLPLPGPLAKLAGHGAARLAGALDRHDSVVLYAMP